MIQHIPCRVASLAAVVLMLGALSGCVSTKSGSELEEIAEVEVEESASELEALEESPLEQIETREAVAESLEEPAREVVLCYLGLEFGSETFLAEIVRVDVDGRMIALVGAGDKVMVRYEEGAHEFSVAHHKASKKERRKNSFAVELRPFTYTKILIQDASDRKQKRLIVRVLQDGDEVEVHSVEY